MGLGLSGLGLFVCAELFQFAPYFRVHSGRLLTPQRILRSIYKHAEARAPVRAYLLYVIVDSAACVCVF